MLAEIGGKKGVKVWRNKAEQTVKVELGTYPNTQEAAEGNVEPKEPEELGGNVDLKAAAALFA